MSSDALADVDLGTLYATAIVLGGHLGSLLEEYTSVGQDVRPDEIVHRSHQLSENLSILNHLLTWLEDNNSRASIQDQDSAELDGRHDPADTIEQLKLQDDERDELDSRPEQHTSGVSMVLVKILDKFDHCIKGLSRLNDPLTWLAEDNNSQASLALPSSVAQTTGDQDSAELDGSHDPAATIERSNLQADEGDKPDSLRWKDLSHMLRADFLDRYTKPGTDSRTAAAEEEKEHQEAKATVEGWKSELYMIWSVLSFLPLHSHINKTVGDQDQATYDWSQFNDQTGPHFAAFAPHLEQGSHVSPAEYAERYSARSKAMRSLDEGSYAVTRLDSQTE